MPGAMPQGLRPGTVLLHRRFYADANGESKPKYLVLLAPMRGGDAVVRLLTSQHGGLRPEQPPCFHGDPYPGFYLGVLDMAQGLGKKSWLDLRRLEDADGMELARLMASGVVSAITTLPADVLRPVLECAAGADDTTRAQELSLRDQLAAL